MNCAKKRLWNLNVAEEEKRDKNETINAKVNLRTQLNMMVKKRKILLLKYLKYLQVWLS